MFVEMDTSVKKEAKMTKFKFVFKGRNSNPKTGRCVCDKKKKNTFKYHEKRMKLYQVYRTFILLSTDETFHC